MAFPEQPKEIKDLFSNFRKFDKRHGEFRKAVFVNLMNRVEEKFANSVRFEGDDNFTEAMQKQLLRMTFRYGYAGIHSETIEENNITRKFKAVENQSADQMALIANPQFFDTNERVIAAQGVTAPKHNDATPKTYFMTQKDSAFIKFNDYSENGYYKWLIPIYMQATGETVLKKKLTTLDQKLAVNTLNNQQATTEYEVIYDIETNSLGLVPSQKSYSGQQGDQAMKINPEDIVKSKLVKIDFSQGESINDVLEFLHCYSSMWHTAFGIRVASPNTSKERKITDEYTSMEAHFQTMENEFKGQVDMFIKEYENVFGKKLTAVFKVDEVLEEMKEQAALEAGHADEGVENENTNS